MLNKMPIRLRLTVLSVLLLTLCCVGLTVTLNVSAKRMADVIESTPVVPATEMGAVAAVPSVPMTTLAPTEHTQKARDQFQYQSILYMALVIVAGGGLTYYMTGKALRPLQELSGQMKNRTVHNLSEELTVPESRDELTDLTVSFNQMSRKLDEAFAMQKRFSQSAAHELRTPLTVLKTKVDVFQKKAEHTPEEYEKLLSVLTTHTDRLAALVKDLLDLTNMDALDCEESIDLSALLTQVVQELKPLASDKQVAISMEGAEKEIRGNSSLLHRAFYNLIENGIKYNVENGAVNITVSDENHHGRVVIADTGIGVPEDAQALIFEPFYRVDKSRSRQMGGAGLGLATVKVIVEKHGGTIQVSTPASGGTQFEIIL